MRVIGWFSAALIVATSCGKEPESPHIRSSANASRSHEDAATPVDASEPDAAIAFAPDASGELYDAGPELTFAAVKCEQGGQLAQTPIIPPTMTAPLTPELARLPNAQEVLRVYSDGVLAILGPVGWRCEGWSDSSHNGMTLAPPDPRISNEQLERRIENRVSSEVVKLRGWYWGTSGRGFALRVEGPLFPDLGAATLRTSDFRYYPPGSFRLVPWPGEKVTVTGRRAVFEDPPWTEGTGTKTTGIAPAALPLRGVVIDQEMSDGHADAAMIIIAMRLASARAGLFDAIRADIEARLARCGRWPREWECWGTTPEMYTGPKG